MAAATYGVNFLLSLMRKDLHYAAQMRLYLENLAGEGTVVTASE